MFSWGFRYGNLLSALLATSSAAEVIILVIIIIIITNHVMDVLIHLVRKKVCILDIQTAEN